MRVIFKRALVLVLLSVLAGGAVCHTAASSPQTAPVSQPASAPQSTVPAVSPSGAKSAAPAAPAKTITTTSRKPAKPKLTARQKQAIDILQSVEGDLGRYSPQMQAYLLQEMASAYKDLNHAQQITLLKEAFQAAANMPEGDQRTEQQNSIVHDLDDADPSALLSLQNSSDPKVRETVLRLLIKDDIDRGRLPSAVSRLTQWDASLAYPYEEAKRAIAKLNAQQAGERQSVFSSALAAFRTSDEAIEPDNKVTELITDSYSTLPPAMVVDAVETVLNKAQKQQEAQQDVHMTLTVGGKKGQATFNNLYDFELFQLLPVLSKLDPAKAEALQRDDANVAALTKKYPDGASSLDPGPSGLGMMISVSDSGSAPSPPNPMVQQMQTAQAIEASAAKDPGSAIASAQTLSNTADWEYAAMTPRCRVLERIAREAVRRKDYATAHSAMQALAAAIQDLPLLAQAHYLAQMAALSAEMGETQTANQYLSKGMKAADGVYQKDAFADPANDACKALWPSAVAWKALLILTARIDPAHALQESASLPDPEIEAVANVAIAGVLLDQEPGMTTISVSHNGKEEVRMMSDVPWWNVPKSGGGSGQTGQ